LEPAQRRWWPRSGRAAAGWTVAIIDFRPFGGTCALRGCDPKKMLIASAETVDSVGRMRGRGVVVLALLRNRIGELCA